VTDDSAAITQTYTEYFRAFQALDTHGVLPYCHVPCMFATPPGVAVATTSEEVAALFAPLMESLRARGYGHSELTDLRVKQLSDTTALLNIRGVRYRTDGAELEPLGAAAIRTKATHHGPDPANARGAGTAATYLINKRRL
jgi:ketosteroid isomerase-like protein